MTKVQDGGDKNNDPHQFVVKRAGENRMKGTIPEQTNKGNPYLVQKIMSANPDQLISYIFDAAIAACGNNDSVKAGNAVRELTKSLNFEYREMAVNFFNVYRYINNNLIKGKFDESRQMLVELKSSWDTAMKVT